MCVTILFYKLMGKNPWFIVRFHFMNVFRDIQGNTTHVLSFMTMEPRGKFSKAITKTDASAAKES